MSASGTILGTQDRMVNKTDQKKSALTEHEDTPQSCMTKIFKN